MSMSNNHDFLHDFVPSTEINIPPENDIISATTDMFEECVKQESLRTSLSFRVSEPVFYQSYINDATLVPANIKKKDFGRMFWFY